MRSLVAARCGRECALMSTLPAASEVEVARLASGKGTDEPPLDLVVELAQGVGLCFVPLLAATA